MPIHANPPCRKREVPKQVPAAFAYQRARSLLHECEIVRCFKMDCVIQHPPNHQIWHWQSPLQKVKLTLEAEHFRDISDIQSGVNELLKGFQ